MKLEEISQIMIGVLAKRENDLKGTNEYLVFNARNYEENEEFDKIRTDKDFTEKLAKQGDILLRLLYPNKVLLVDDKTIGCLVPSQFCIIRPDKNKINPIVLKWYLESEKVTRELERKATGSIIKSMSVKELKTLTIPKISKDDQEKMVELITLKEQERRNAEKIMQKREKLYNYYLERILGIGEKYERI